MKSEDEMKGMLEILLSVPGMDDQVKTNLSLSRKQVMLMCSIVREGMKNKTGMSGDLMKVLAEEPIKGLETFTGELLEKAGMTGLYEKIGRFKS